MASEKLRRPENVPGDFFVDTTCIDCDTCRWVAPASFKRAGGMSAVLRQPATPEERKEAIYALLSCPTASIGCAGDKKEIFDRAKDFPLPIADGVHYCGFAAKDSFGAAAYFIQREGGNVLVDSPRINAGLAKSLQAMGGIRWLVLTHRDDVADHQEWADRFGCERVLHKDDVDAATQGVELQPEGIEPVKLAEDLTFIPVPGHTKGHAVLLYRNFLFTGDHLEFDEDVQSLRSFRDYCWYDWAVQRESMRRLANYEFEWVLPGHGRRGHADKATMKKWMRECVEWMR